MRKKYTSDLTDTGWEYIKDYLPKQKRRLKWSYREIINGILYITKNGCTWRNIPGDFGIPWSTIYRHFRFLGSGGYLERIHDELRRLVRQLAGYKADPSVGILDSQSIKTTPWGGIKGFDNWKKVNGLKLSVVVDTQGWILSTNLSPANDQDKKAARGLMKYLADNVVDYPRLSLFLADGNYRYGKFMPSSQANWKLIASKEDSLDGKKHPRWVVERTFAWVGTARRLLRHFERTAEATLAFIHTNMIRLMVNRLNK